MRSPRWGVDNWRYSLDGTEHHDCVRLYGKNELGWSRRDTATVTHTLSLDVVGDCARYGDRLWLVARRLVELVQAERAVGKRDDHWQHLWRSSRS